MKFLNNRIAKILIINFILQSSVQAKSLDEGAIIFKDNCNVCHIAESHDWLHWPPNRMALRATRTSRRTRGPRAIAP